MKKDKMLISEYAEQMPDGVKFLVVLKRGKYYEFQEGSSVPIQLMKDRVHHIIEENKERHIVSVDEELFIPHKIKFEMDMPRCCGECPFGVYEWSADLNRCQCWGDVKDIGKYEDYGKPENCPLLECEKVEGKL